MKHIKQSCDECQLVTLAMLFDLDIEEIREAAFSILGIPWYIWIHYNCKHIDSFARIVVLILKRVAGSEIAEWYDNFIEEIKPEFSSSTQILGGSKPPSEYLDLSGKGQLTVFFAFNSSGHAMAYENGMIFDGNRDHPIPFNEWKATQQYGVITKFVVTPIDR